MTDGAVVRLNDTGGGTTSLQGNGFAGAQIDVNSDVFLGVSTVLTNGVLDILVSDFSIANEDGSITFGSISCEPGQTSGTLCP